MAYSKRHYRLLSNGAPNTPAQAEELRIRRDIAAQVNRERVECWPKITTENAQKILDWQAARMAELELQRLGRRSEP